MLLITLARLSDPGMHPTVLTRCDLIRISKTGHHGGCRLSRKLAAGAETHIAGRSDRTPVDCHTKPFLVNLSTCADVQGSLQRRQSVRGEFHRGRPAYTPDCLSRHFHVAKTLWTGGGIQMNAFNPAKLSKASKDSRRRIVQEPIIFQAM